LKFSLNNGDQHQGGHEAAALRFACFLVVANKLLDARVLFDPTPWHG